jgi:hypothetical protein
VFLNTEFAEDTEKKEKRTGLKTGQYKRREARLGRPALQRQDKRKTEEGTNGDALQNKYTDV